MSASERDQVEPAQARLTALTLDQVVVLLQRSGAQRFSAETLRADVANGAPLNGDGTMNLLAYGAWLVRALASRSDRG